MMEDMTPLVRRIATFFLSAVCVVTGFAQKNPDSPLIKVADHPMVRARMGPAAVLSGDYIYVFGGTGGGAPIYRAERFNLRTQRAEEIPVDFLARRYHGAVEHEGKFYIFGGQSIGSGSRAHEARVEVYDPATGRVEFIDDMPRPRARAAVVKLGTEVWMVGGEKAKEGRSTAQTNEVEIFDLATKQWRPGPPMPTPRAGTGTLVGSFIVIPGGFASRTSRDEVEMYVPQEQGWKRLPRLSEQISAHATAVLGRWMFLFGDFEMTDRVLAYELPTRKTSAIKPGYADARNAIAISTPDRIYVIGGAANDGGELGSSRGTNQAVTRGTERALIQEFALNPDYRAK